MQRPSCARDFFYFNRSRIGERNERGTTAISLAGSAKPHSGALNRPLYTAFIPCVTRYCVRYSTATLTMLLLTDVGRMW